VNFNKTTTYLDNLIRNFRGSIEFYEFPQKTLDDWKNSLCQLVKEYAEEGRELSLEALY
jgi:hypothetical protein